MLARLLHGGRWSLLGTLVVCPGTIAVGFALGVLAAVGPRWLDALVSTATTTFQAVPGVLLALALAIALTVLCANLLGNALRDQVDVVGPLH